MDQLAEFANNHLLLVSATVLMALVVLFYEIRLRGRGLTEISTAQAVQLINKGARIVDLRDQQAFDAAHIVGAIRVPSDELSADKRLKKNRAVLVICDNGVSSSRCIDGLRKAGFDSAFSLKGGLAAWRQENLPLVGPGKG